MPGDVWRVRLVSTCLLMPPEPPAQATGGGEPDKPGLLLVISHSAQSTATEW